MFEANYSVPEAELKKRAAKDGITHISTGVAVVRNGKILAVRRSAGDFLGGNFELPGGGIEGDETFVEAVKREILEETGLCVSKILSMFDGFDYTTPSKPKVRQMNFLVEVGDQEVILSHEHDRYAWISHETVDSLQTTGPMSNCFRRALESVDEISRAL